MKQIPKNIIAVFISAVLASILGNIASSQFVISGLSTIGAPLTFSDRITMTLSDIAGFGPMYAVFIFLGFLIAFLAGGLVYRFAKTRRTLIYMVAGFTAMVVMLYAMKNVFFGVQLVAGARSLSGVIVQGLIGGATGYIFARLTAPKNSAASTS